MNATNTFVFTLIQHTCWVCGVKFGLDRAHENNLRANGETFYCPRGCPLAFGESDAEKLRKELEAKERSILGLREQREQANRRAVSADMARRATKGHLNRLKRRVAGGVCPCCNRTFANLGAHMKGKHPEFANEK